MSTLLIIIGVLGLGALLISAYVFAAAARRYVSGKQAPHYSEVPRADLSPYRRSWVDRSSRDRRSRDTQPAEFPIIVRGVRIERDRRMNPDRRRAA